jgi:hypothetical protein
VQPLLNDRSFCLFRIAKTPAKNGSLFPDYSLMRLPNGGSDHHPFLDYLAIPVVKFTYTNNSGQQYPLYHSMYETPFVNEHLFDTDNFAVIYMYQFFSKY